MLADPMYIYEKLPTRMRDALLHDADNVTDVFVVDNGDGYIEGYGRKENVGKLTTKQISTFMCLAAAVSPNRTFLNRTSPAIMSSLPQGERITGKRPPLGEWSFTIRSHLGYVATWDSWVDGGSMSWSQANCIRELVSSGKRVINVGEVGSGKSTLLTTMLNDESISEQKMVIFESVKEIIGPPQSTAYLIDVLGGGANSILEVGMRESAKIVVLGEARSSRELSPVLEAMSKGMPCYSTFHAKDIEETLMGMSTQLRGQGDSRTPKEIKDYILTFVDAFLFMRKETSGLRRLTGIGVTNKKKKEVEMIDV